MRLIVRLQGFDGHGGEGDGAPARFRLGLLELQFAPRAMHGLIDGQLTALQSTSDQRNLSSSPRRTPVVTATRTGSYRLVPFAIFNSVAISCLLSILISGLSAFDGFTCRAGFFTNTSRRMT